MKIPLIYIGALIFGIIVAAGLAAFMHQPLPLQVVENPYAPAPAPAPAIPTIVPALTPTGPFDPAPAPVIVTTMPLPTITPVPEETRDYATTCNISSPNSAESMGCMTAHMMSLTMNLMPLMFIMVIASFALSLISSVLAPGRRR